MNPKVQLMRLGVRWLLNSLGIWVASLIIGGVELSGGIGPILIAGLVLALVNAILKPTAILLSLPFILLSLGFFILFVNGLMVLIADALYGGLTIDGYLNSILAGLVIGLVNYVATLLLEGWKKNKEDVE